MRNGQLAWTWSLMLGLCMVIPQRALAQGTSTPEERAQWGGWQALSFLNYLFTLDIEVSMDNTTPLVTV